MVAFNFRFMDTDVYVKWTFLALMGFFLFLTGSPVLIAILLISLFGHEMSHILVGRYYGRDTHRMDLWILGAVAYMKNTPLSDAKEFWIFFAGPMYNFILAGAAALLHVVGGEIPMVDSVLHLFIQINLILGIFNLMPAYPMDGGRILKSILGMMGVSERKKKNITHYVGYGMAVLFAIAGLFAPSPILVMIGAFVAFHIWQERKSL